MTIECAILFSHSLDIKARWHSRVTHRRNTGRLLYPRYSPMAARVMTDRQPKCLALAHALHAARPIRLPVNVRRNNIAVCVCVMYSVKTQGLSCFYTHLLLGCSSKLACMHLDWKYYSSSEPTYIPSPHDRPRYYHFGIWVFVFCV